MNKKTYNPSTTSKTTSITFRCPNDIKVRIDNKIKELNCSSSNGKVKITQTEWLVSIIENALQMDQKDPN